MVFFMVWRCYSDLSVNWIGVMKIPESAISEASSNYCEPLATQDMALSGIFT
jgi:hypothetical protein